MKKALVVLFMIACVLAFVFGWASNVVQLITAYDTMGASEAIARAVGIFVAPFGAVMGYF